MSRVDDVPLDGLNTDGVDPDGVQRMIVVTVPADVCDVVGDRFWQLGVRAVSDVDLVDGLVEVTSSVGNSQDAIDRAVATFDPAWSWRVDDVATAPADEWRSHAAPVRYHDRMVMVPAWLDDHPDIGPDDHVTLVEPGSAFGLGDHPTTKGSMAMLVDLLHDASRPIASVLDVGCGTGVLAIRAAQHGVPRVRAIDVADAAASATRHNAELNEVSGRVDVDTAPLAEVAEVFDVVVANILAPVLVALADDLVRVTAPGGSLIISGIIESHHRHVLDALLPLVPHTSTTEDGWITIVLRHR